MGASRARQAHASVPGAGRQLLAAGLEAGSHRRAEQDKGYSTTTMALSPAHRGRKLEKAYVR